MGNEPREANVLSARAAAVEPRKKAEPPAPTGGPGDEARKAELSSLARSPDKAMQRWSNLSRDERMQVEEMMNRNYGEAFLRAFLKRVGTAPKPNNSATITSDPYWTPERLKAAGYRFKQQIGADTSIWVHPSGNEIWVMSQPKAQAPGSNGGGGSGGGGPVAPGVIMPHPDLDSARGWARTIPARFAQVKAECERLMAKSKATGSISQAENDAYYEMKNRLENDLKSVVGPDGDSKSWFEGATEDEREEFTGISNQLKATQKELDDLGL